MKPLLMNPMLGSVRSVLGQIRTVGLSAGPGVPATPPGGPTRSTPPTTTRIYGPRHTGGYGSVQPQWTYDDLVSQGQSQQIHVFSEGRDLWFDPSPQAYANRVGICEALHTGFSRGLTIPWIGAAYDVAPGVFFPGKTWAQIVADSERVKQNLPADQSNWNCYLWIKNNGHTPSTFCDISSQGNVSSAGQSATMPSNNRVVISTAAQWRSAYGNDAPPLCTGSNSKQTVTDPVFGHSYTVTTAETLVINSDGTTSVVNQATPSPILTVQYGNNGVFGGNQYTADSLRAAIAAQQFPLNQSSITKVFWNDTGAATTPAAVIALASAGVMAAGAGVAAAGTDWGTILGYGGLALGGILLLSSLTKK